MSQESAPCEVLRDYENTWPWFLGGSRLNRHYLLRTSSAKTNPSLAFGNHHQNTVRRCR
jgi:hypothetical protein